MTFSLIGRCARTGQFGAAVSTSNFAVGTRVPFAAPGIGAVLTQHRTDPRLGSRGLDLLRSGCSAAETVAALVASTPHHAWRQLAVIDGEGRTAHFNGAHVKPAIGNSHGRDCVAIGNILKTGKVTDAMAATFEKSAASPLAERLLRALEAGLAAGGEHGPVYSAALYVVDKQVFPYVDLRIDKADEPIAELRTLWEAYVPWLDEFVVRAVDPDNAKGVS
jgi:uncharacterized Ntn-hydrolase superfamily protein